MKYLMWLCESVNIEFDRVRAKGKGLMDRYSQFVGRYKDRLHKGRAACVREHPDDKFPKYPPLPAEFSRADSTDESVSPIDSEADLSSPPPATSRKGRVSTSSLRK